ncbi:MAG: tetratricopeptide repeat protein [Pyrinomonadaceae bacterium]
MALQTRRSFVENIAAGLQGSTLQTTILLYLFTLAVLVPLSFLVIRVFNQKPPNYVIPLLVLLLIIAEYLYAWRLLFNSGPKRLLLYAGLLSAIIYAGYRVPSDFMDRSWPFFDVVRRSFSWLFGGAVVQSILAPLTLLVGYCAIYYTFRIRGRRFIVVSDFRVWGDLTNDFPGKGVAACLRDELMRLVGAMRSPEQAELELQADAASSAEAELLPRLPEEGGLSLPETHVTLQYQGISLEVMNTFIRRTSGREIVLTGDLMATSNDLTVAARASELGPWRVVLEKPPPRTLVLGLQRLAIRIMTTMTKTYQPHSARTYALLQIKAREVQDYEEAFRLAKLGRAVATDLETANWNLATAHHDIGVELANKGKDDNEKYWEAIREFEEATKLEPAFVEAYDYLGLAYKKLGEKEKAAEAFRRAEKIRAREPRPEA